MKWMACLIAILSISTTAFASSGSHKPIKSISQTQPWVALTFDDGPDPRFTYEVVDMLNRHHEKATFFFVGQRIRTYPDAARYVLQYGNEIANHSYSHPNMRRITEEEIYDEILRGNRILWETTGRKSPWFRAPGGAYNERIRNAATRADVQLIGWYEDTRDWSSIGPDRIFQNAMKTLKPGHIILFHDCCGQVRRKTVKALDQILTEIEERGFRCVTLSEMMGAQSNVQSKVEK